ncbi:hypothetical protein EBR66_01535 [bacterium]|nr:hypothetical protein [bacterium]
MYEIYLVLKAVWKVVWGTLNIAFALPFFGWFIQTAFYFCMALFIYKYTPAWVRTTLSKVLAPYLGRFAHTLRIQLAKLLAGGELSTQTTDAARVEYRDRVVYRSRPLKQRVTMSLFQIGLGAALWAQKEWLWSLARPYLPL